MTTLEECFDSFAATAFRYEGRASYLVPEEEARVEAFRRGEPRPERSVRTSPWLARVAVTTVSEGKQWQRVVVLADPLTDYQRYRIAGLIESQAAGEEIRIMPGHAPAGVAGPDFWLFDDETAVVLDYDIGGGFTGTRILAAPADVAAYARCRRAALAVSVPLNEYLARHRQVTAAA